MNCAKNTAIMSPYITTMKSENSNSPKANFKLGFHNNANYNRYNI